MPRICFLLFVFTFGIAIAQDSVNGKIFGDDAVAPYIKISNITKSTTTFSNENGSFSLQASIGDTLIFDSSFYQNKTLIISTIHFSETLVIQLKEEINLLEEVILKNETKIKEFNLVVFNEELNVLIKTDIENQPWEYKPQPDGQYGVNLAGFLYLAKKIFPKDEHKYKYQKKKYVSKAKISYNDLMILNSTDNFFTDAFITNDLKIPKEFKYVFFAYFEDQKISTSLLSSENTFLLIEKLFEVSTNYKNRMNQTEKSLKD